jgi:hydrogenase maturation factor
MVTESIFHNFVVNDAEGAERIAEALDDSMSETTKGGFAEIKKDGVDFTYISDPEELKELVAKKWKKNVVHFSPSEGESATFTPLDISGEK